MVSATYVETKKGAIRRQVGGDVMNMCTEQVSKYFSQGKGLTYRRDKDGAAGVVPERSQPFPDVFLEVLPHNILKNELQVRLGIVHSGPLVLGTGSLNSPTPTEDRDQTVSPIIFPTAISVSPL